MINLTYLTLRSPCYDAYSFLFTAAVQELHTKRFPERGRVSPEREGQGIVGTLSLGFTVLLCVSRISALVSTIDSARGQRGL